MVPLLIQVSEWGSVNWLSFDDLKALKSPLKRYHEVTLVAVRSCFLISESRGWRKWTVTGWIRSFIHEPLLEHDLSYNSLPPPQRWFSIYFCRTKFRGILIGQIWLCMDWSISLPTVNLSDKAALVNIFIWAMDQMTLCALAAHAKQQTGKVSKLAGGHGGQSAARVRHLSQELVETKTEQKEEWIFDLHASAGQKWVIMMLFLLNVYNTFPISTSWWEYV